MDYDFERGREPNLRKNPTPPKAAPLGQSVRSTTVAAPVVGKECPKCSTLNALTNRECRSCGIVFERYRPVEDTITEELAVAGHTELILLWNALLEDFSNQSKHDAFLQACRSAESLPYAAKKYAEILEVAPHQETAKLMRRRVMGFASVRMDGASPVMSKDTWQMPLPSFNSFILFLGVILLVVGMGLPHTAASGMRDIAKLGAAMIALSLGLRYYLRKPA